MTCVNVFAFQNAIFVWTDAVGYDVEGIVTSIGSKVGILPHLNAVVTARGPVFAMPLLTRNLSAWAETFDGLIATLPVLVERTARQFADVFDLSFGGPTFEVVVSGFSELNDRPEIWAIRSGETAAQRCEDVCLSPGDADTWPAIHARLPSFKTEHLATVETGLAIMKVQRGMKFAQAEGLPPIFGIGGFAQLTIITRQDIRTGIAHRWRDRIGERISP